jgi:hypothetical protein
MYVNAENDSLNRSRKNSPNIEDIMFTAERRECTFKSRIDQIHLHIDP